MATISEGLGSRTAENNTCRTKVSVGHSSDSLSHHFSVENTDIEFPNSGILGSFGRDLKGSHNMNADEYND